MSKLRREAEVVVLNIVSRPSEVFKEIWIINDDLNRPIERIEYEEFMEALEILSFEG